MIRTRVQNTICVTFLLTLALLMNPSVTSCADDDETQATGTTVEESTSTVSSPLLKVTQPLIRGREYEQRGHLQLAAEAYREVVSASPAYVEGHHRLGNVLRRIDPQSVEALQHLEYCVQARPSHPGYRMELANAYIAADKEAKAIEQYEALVRMRPKDPQLVNRLANLYMEQGNDRRAAQLYNTLMEQHPNQVAPMVNLAQIHREQGNYEQALSLLNRSLSNDPDNYYALVERGKAMMAIGNATSAAQDLETALRSNPLNPDTYRLLAQARLQSGNREGARQASKMAETFSELPPAQAQQLYRLYQKPRRTPRENIYLGTQLSQLGRLDLAQNFLEQGLQRNYGNRSAWYLLGLLRYQQRDFQGAVQAFENSGSYLNRQGVDQYRYMSSALLNAGEYRKARKYVREGLKSYPNDQALLRTREAIQAAQQPKPEMTANERERIEDMRKRQRYIEEMREKGLLDVVD